MLRALVCCADARKAESDLGPTLLWRKEVLRRVVTRADAARSAVRELPRLMLVERDLPWAADLTRDVRGAETTRTTSIAVYAPPEFDPVEMELLQSGANAVLRLPVTRDWDKRLARLLHVPPRQAVRVPMFVEVEGGVSRRTTLGSTLNLSETGLLVQAPSLELHGEITFAFRLPGAVEPVRGRARVVRVGTDADSFGLEFSELEGDCLEAIRNFVTRRVARDGAAKRDD